MTSGDPFARTEDAGDISLRLLVTSDLHCEIMAYDYYTDRACDRYGLVRTASLIRKARAEVANTLLVDVGDFLQGAPVGDLWAEQPERLDDGPHPMLAAMNTAGVEVSTLGNHDFNYGLPFLERCLEGAAFPVINANVIRDGLAAEPGHDLPYFAPHVILKRRFVTRGGDVREIKIGVIGFCPPQIMGWDKQNLAGRVEARDVVAAARVQVPRLRAAGADIVIALSHGGISPRPSAPGREQFARDLAEVPGIDVIAAGHQHRTFPGPGISPGPGIDPAAGTLEGVPAVMPSFGGARLGLIDLRLRSGYDGWRVAAHDARTWPVAQFSDGAPVAEVAVDPEVARVAAPAHAATLDYVRQPIGKTARAITTYFSLVTNDVALQMVADAQAELVRNAIAQTGWADLPLLSVAAPFKCGGSGGPDYYTHLPPGPVALHQLMDLYLYPNTVCGCVLTGAQVRGWIERSAGVFAHIPTGAQDVPLLAPGYPTYNFDVISGVTYRIDVTRPSRYTLEGVLADPDAHRVQDLACQGRPVADDDRFFVVTNSYRGGGGGQFPGADGSTIVWQCGNTARQLLVDRVAATDCLDLTPNPGWSFASNSGTSVLYPSAPEAARHLPETGIDIEPAGPGADGFALYRIRL